MYEQVFQLHAKLLKALSHPKRLEIIHLLRSQELSVMQIQAMLDLPQANLSQHLHVLREASVVQTRKDGKQIYYRLAHANFIKACDFLREVLIEQYKDDPLVDEMTKKMTDLVPVVADPVCGMRLSPKTAAFATQYYGGMYYFCASRCLERFQRNPKKFIQKET